MTQGVKYKRPRKFNIVTFVLLLLLAFGAYMAYQHLPLFLLRHDVYRVLEEHGSKVVARRAMYMSDHKALEALRTRMTSELRLLGVDDPEAEVWIEVERHEARLGAIYSKWVTWPFDVIARQEKVYEVEHVAPIP